MAADDGAMRERLVEDGSLFDGYNPLMAIVHRRNGDRLGEMVDAHGWPGAGRGGALGALGRLARLRRVRGELDKGCHSAPTAVPRLRAHSRSQTPTRRP